MRTLSLTLLNLALIAGIAHTAYQHGFYVGSIDAQANNKALQQTGYIAPAFIDSTEPTRWSE